MKNAYYNSSKHKSKTQIHSVYDRMSQVQLIIGIVNISNIVHIQNILKNDKI